MSQPTLSLQRVPLLDKKPGWFALSIAMVTVLAGIDLVTFKGELSPFAGLIAIGPLVACCFLSLRQTSLVSLYSFVWLFALGQIANQLFSPQYAGIAVPTMCACLFALWGAQRRISHEAEQEEQRLNTSRAFFLAQASSILNSSLDYEETLQNVAQAALGEFSQWCVIAFKDGEEIRVASIAHSDPAMVRRANDIIGKYPIDPKDETDAVSLSIKEGRPKFWSQLSANVAMATRSPRDQAVQGLGFRSLIVVPLEMQGTTSGAIMFANGIGGRRFSEDDFVLAQDLASRATIAIQHSLLYRERDSIARTLQASLLPPVLPRIGNLDIAAAYRPVKEGTQVGGDFYDCFAMPDGRWLTVIGDVQGKGVEAAVLTSLVHYTLRTVSMKERSPAKMLQRINEVLWTHNNAGRHCTIALVAMDVDEDEEEVQATISLAGHPEPLLRRADGTVERVGQVGTLLGALKHIETFDQEITLHKDDVLMLYSDGLSEARGNDTLFEEEQMELEMRNIDPGLSAESLAASMEMAAMRWCEGVPADDIAIMMIRVAQPDVIIALSLPNSNDSVTTARRQICHALQDHHINDEDMALIVSELTTNAIKYGIGDGAIQVLVLAQPDSIRLEITSPGQIFSAEGLNPGHESIGGRGLMLVDAVSTAWGVRGAGPGRVCVWAEAPKTPLVNRV